jgi:protein arginine N-methyltransferase 1
LTNPCGLDLRSFTRYSVNYPVQRHFPPSHLVGDFFLWATLDYGVLDSPHVSGTAEWVLPRAATLHGLLVWFDSELAEGIGFSNHPAEPRKIFGQFFLPCEHPIPFAAGDRVRATISADPVSAGYCYQWETVADDARGKQKASFRQSGFLSTFISPKALVDARQTAVHLLEHKALDPAGLRQHGPV